MPKQFNELRERLLRAGVAPRHVRRYLAELADHLADLKAEEESAGRSRDDAESIALDRLGTPDELTRAMTEKRHYRSWCARAPWAMFGFAPLFILAGAYFVACFILWSGWQIFVPGAETPFGARNGGPIYGLQNIYFQADKFYYFGAPILVGWLIALMAARQRIKAIWPAIGFVLIALMGATAQIDANRTTVPGPGHIRMSFGSWPSVQGTYDSLFHASVIFLLAVLPYALWRWRTKLDPVLNSK